MATFNTYQTIYSLDEVNFPAGTTYVLKYTVVNQSGTAINISGSTVGCKIGEFGTSDAILSKSGNILSSNVFSVTLNAVDSNGLSGKYVQQPYVLNSSGVNVIPAQGIILITNGLT